MNLNSLIDHTLLKPTTTQTEILQLCDETKKYKFWSVCVNPVWVKLAKEQGVKVCSVIGFPLGANTLAVKVAEARQAIKDGAEELDVVITKPAEIKKTVAAVLPVANNKIIKVIIETCYLTNQEKILAAKLVKQSGADFVKTSTGFGPGGATVADVKLLRKVVGPDFGVKASGGIKTKEQAMDLVAAGANRLGTSSGVDICR
ncbi:deoxyribose-phosphate aldolase [Candidatus Beckwithbacteria bacterium CG22_combo_CG10-13_8_21_14_all_01_47_9]|uniref:Deoxyribose-phosphate aldolase n=5 Tax=Candidatus Beckwithiibacteriota TaxID=1752726 RepID=A0A2H0E0X8_9BACT|nr:MAG: deoxyribose-phosphate aldolase [Candidatus Beckwithbacteria bacterium CG1_02_47_37]PIP52581.1 MAG: deoxyribose-phosphate aldolase [Candidatus Beckwithbacteria bacterium CG23_combo_of_CG06-09_8_20_14_all_47_9]PIP87490.1 MAG: deoxyribose-phosphate aldolase [Candidatus Beckwithbacteria bacterium CG22_combo_CG10-13_8_21_14_all_01_47_9]PJA22347.1 MAG: deoxyribose-phosphate aldolase [Candidatus Beckwithbacteria bacterium CG_4_10_14_0_2_um_filter_47_25]PJC66167.1 MAG: deoxyribose-phosphate ald